MAKYDGPINPDPADDEASIVIYGYIPSLAVGISAVVLFGLLFITHAVFLVRYWRRGTRGFESLILLGCAMEIVGYAFRIASHYRPFVVIYFVLNYFMIVCAPIFFSAAIYLALSAILRRTSNPKAYCPLSPRALITTFVIADVLTIATQVTGAALIGVAESRSTRNESSPVTPDQANDILLAGLAVQSSFFALFLALLALVLFRLRRRRNSALEPGSEKARGAGAGHVGRGVLVVLALSALLVFLRTLFRLAETAEGVFSDVSTNEDYFTGLEFVPVVLALALWVLVPLGRALQEAERRTYGPYGAQLSP